MAVLATVFATGADADHVAVGWGANGSGQVGDGTFDDAPAMVAVDAAGALQGQKVVDIDAGSEASCAVTDRGAVACWGLQRPPGEPPVGVSSPVYMDTASLFPGAVATAVEVGDSEICALGSNGRIGCWSSGRARLLGGVLADHSATQISMGRDHGCAVVAVRYDRVLACWGTNDHGQLGDGTRQEREQPAFVDTSGVLAGETIVDVSAADDFTCAMTRQDRIACWGANGSGELGNSTTVDSAVPVLVDTNGALKDTDPYRLATSIGSHMCVAFSKDIDNGWWRGEIWNSACWGAGTHGELGNGVQSGSSVPVDIKAAGAAPDGVYYPVTMGTDHACGRIRDDTAVCWGAGASGQLGDSRASDSLAPVAVTDQQGNRRPLVALVAGGRHNLAVFGRGEGLGYVPLVEPRRVLDTRGSAAVGGPVGPVGSGSPLVVDLSAAVPEKASAVSFNLTATGQTASGYAELGSAGGTGGSSTLNWMGPQQTIANAHISAISADRTVELRVTSSGSAHLVLDITGYFVPGNTPGAAVFIPTPERVFDSRIKGGRLGPGATMRVPIYPHGMSPIEMPVAAAVNVTVTGTTGSGVVTVSRDRSNATSTVNWSGPGQTMSNALITSIAYGDSFTITNNSATGTAFVVVDRSGVFWDARFGGLEYHPVEPLRIYDSRFSDRGPLVGDGQMVTTSPLPGNARGQVVNTTVTGTTGTGYLGVSPYSGVSLLNWYGSPTTRANGAILIAEGKTELTARVGGRGSTHFMYDLVGYFG